MKKINNAIRELSLCGISAREAFALANSIKDTRIDPLLTRNDTDSFWTNLYSEKYVERFEETFKKVPGYLPLVKKAALEYLQGKEPKRFLDRCARLHISNYYEEIREEAYYTTLAYSAIEAVRRRDVV